MRYVHRSIQWLKRFKSIQCESISDLADRSLIERGLPDHPLPTLKTQSACGLHRILSSLTQHEAGLAQKAKEKDMEKRKDQHYKLAYADERLDARKRCRSHFYVIQAIRSEFERAASLGAANVIRNRMLRMICNNHFLFFLYFLRWFCLLTLVNFFCLIWRLYSI